MRTFLHERMFNRVNTLTLQLAHLAFRRFQVTFTLIICKCAFHGNSKPPAKPNLHVCKCQEADSILNILQVSFCCDKSIFCWIPEQVSKLCNCDVFAHFIERILDDPVQWPQIESYNLNDPAWKYEIYQEIWLLHIWACRLGEIYFTLLMVSLFSPNSNLFFPRMMSVCGCIWDPVIYLFIY